MSLDTSNMKIVMTNDGMFRYVCHTQRILTTGFTKRVALQRNSEGFLDTPIAMQIMQGRYAKEYPQNVTQIT
jgi:hypothetical protein